MSRKTDKITPDEVERLASLGLSIALMAGVFDVHERTLYKLIARKPELQERLREGRENVKVRLRAELLKQAFGGNTRVLLRLAEAEGVLSPVGVTVQGRDGRSDRDRGDGQRGLHARGQCSPGKPPKCSGSWNATGRSRVMWIARSAASTAAKGRSPCGPPKPMLGWFLSDLNHLDPP
ncbi:hypothetical protein [Acidomonas methanolica]|uniref:hypothetical protein n=1 Tax=Acidomonas methanolica TaxID=437 RepID=UPI002119F834|nr:hypothetical protein [Acidomonas methanolica]MCQ9156802.1 hypothetical protein [Acidomonas methanolica]